jgi:outer membrane protein assembly factor BamB
MSRFALFAVVTSLLAVPVGAAPVPKGQPGPSAWPMFGGTPARNMVNLREKLEKFPVEGPDWENKEAVKKWEAEWVLWKGELGTRAYAGPVVAGGKVFVGTNNERPRNVRDQKLVPGAPPDPIDKGIMMVFDEKTGKFLWQAVHDPRPNQGVLNWQWEGQCSTPTVVGDRVYYVTIRCTLVCADVNGFANGNQGIQNEKYNGATDADIIWEYDMIRELNVAPHDMSNGCPLVIGDRIFVTTSNGVDGTHTRVPEPDAPSLICLDCNTGKLLWKDNSPGKDILHGQWSSVTYAEGPVPQVIHGQGDGWLRSFDSATGKLLWKFDCNPKDAKHELGGTGTKNDFLATPVVHNGRVYIGTGQDPEHSTGPAHLWCIDLKKAVELGAKEKNRDVSPDLFVRVEIQPGGKEKVITKENPASAAVWCYGGPPPGRWAARDFKFGRTMSNVAVVDDVIYAAELDGHLHCLNAKTGDPYWQFDAMASIWGSPYFVDGKVLIGTEEGTLFVLKHDPKPDVIDHFALGAKNQAEARQMRKAAREQVKKKYTLAKIELHGPIRSTPTVVNGVLFVATETTLFAIGKK